MPLLLCHGFDRARPRLRRRALLGAAMATAIAATCPSISMAQSAAESATQAAMAQARQQGPESLRAFLHEMPKGADLHLHLSGAVYAETLLAEAGEDGLCVDTQQLKLVPAATSGRCADGQVPATSLPRQQPLYDAMIDALSMRTFVAHSGESGHDHFFDTFGRFAAVDASRHAGEWLAEITHRAALQNEQYLEIMHTPSFAHAIALSAQLGFKPDFAGMRKALLEGGLDQDLQADRQSLDHALAQRSQIQHCGTTQADPGCKVEVRFLYQVLRGAAPERVFAQTLLGFEAAAHDPRWVGINYVMPEDGYLSMRDYDLQMRMLDYLHKTYPATPISLHAGELAEGLVAPEGLRFHIREAVEQGHASRIGHGVDLMDEDRPQALLHELATRHVLVEINLTSNDVILGVSGARHPLHAYLAAGVPTALSTDDEGVSRIDLTHEYVKAVEEQNLDYLQLKRMARNSLEHSFLPGHSLWAQTDQYQAMAAPCRGSSPAHAASSTCQAWLAANPRAGLQWQLEQRFVQFETGHS
ncbi:adenosine deaminase family protein [Frateuria aurantia]